MNERKEKCEGQNQPAPEQGEGGQPGLDHDVG